MALTARRSTRRSCMPGHHRARLGEQRRSCARRCTGWDEPWSSVATCTRRGPRRLPASPWPRQIRRAAKCGARREDEASPPARVGVEAAHQGRSSTACSSLINHWRSPLGGIGAQRAAATAITGQGKRPGRARSTGHKVRSAPPATASIEKPGAPRAHLPVVPGASPMRNCAAQGRETAVELFGGHARADVADSLNICCSPMVVSHPDARLRARGASRRPPFLCVIDFS